MNSVIINGLNTLTDPWFVFLTFYSLIQTSPNDNSTILMANPNET